MVLTEKYVFLTTAAMITVIIAKVAKKKKNLRGIIPWDNSIYLGHVTLTSWIFFEIFTSVKYHRDMEILKMLACNSKGFRYYGIFKK